MRRIFNFKKYLNQKGTTLVEMLVALSIFSIFMSVAVGGFIQALSNQRVVLKLISATDNLSMVLEEIMRQIRVGTNFSTNSQQGTLEFDWPDTENQSGVMRHIIYSKEINPSSGLWGIKRKISTLDSSGNPIPGTEKEDFVTADSVDVVGFIPEANPANFFASPGPCLITITIGIKATDRGVSITNHIQTSISSRIFTETCQNI
jgi:prepilin-type N-terminal cleavage/methylation domain-containing protein